MRAIQVQVPGGPQALIEVELPEPQPGRGQVRVRAEAIGVGRPDVLIRQGTYKWMPPLPAIPGAELAGIVDAIGNDVNEWQIGDRVLVSARELSQRGGCYAQAIVVAANAPYRLPTNISFVDAMSLPNLQLALALMRVSGLNTSDAHENKQAVLITGASGGVATMLSLLCRHLGFVTIGTSRSQAKADFARAHGFVQVLENGLDDLPAKVQGFTGGKGVACAFDHLGGKALIACLQTLAPLGTAVSYNVVQGPPSEDVFQVLRKLLGKSLALRCFSMHTFDEDVKLRRELMTSAMALLAEGKIKVPQAHLLKLSEVRHAHELLDQGLVSGKIVMQI